MRFFILFFFLIFNKLLIAYEDLGKVVASPNKSLLQLEKTGSSVLLIEKSQLDNSSSTSTTGLLQEFGGFSVAPKGNKGSDSSYFNRGLARKYIKVLVDGMDLSDITSTQEEPTYIDNINISNIDNIEILNGSQGTLYGGGAVGGVISLNSSLPDKIGMTLEHFIEGGSYGTVNNAHSIKFLNDNIKLSFNFDSERSTGYHSFVESESNHNEKDGYYLYGANFLSNFKINHNLEINFNGRTYYQHNEFDDNYSYPGDTLLYYRYDKAKALLLDVTYTKKNISHKLTFQPTYTTRINASQYGRTEYDGRKNKLEYLISANFWNISNLFGIDYLKKNADISGKLTDQDVYSIFSEFKLKPASNTYLDISGRREYDSNYGSFDTARVQLNKNFLKNTVLRASIGSGYRTPTPYELYSQYGDTNLKPETSLTYDIGGEFKFKKGSTNLYFGVYETKIEDIIVYSASKYRQSNSNLKSYGTEFRINTKLHDNIVTGVKYTKTNGKENDGDSIKLVPKDKVILFTNIKPLQSLDINASYHYQNKAKDTLYNELPVYRSLNLNVNYVINKKSKLFFKLENALNKSNTLNRAGSTYNNLGYKNPDRSFYLGFKVIN
mgnify:CR=1 FL=1